MANKQDITLLRQGVEVWNAWREKHHRIKLDLRGANLQGAHLREVNLREVNLRGIHLRGTYLWGADLQNAQLQNADLQGAQLRNANLQGANLQGANLQGAQLPEADLRAAQLQGAHLQGANLRGANLTQTNLSHAILTGTRLYGTIRNGWIVEGIQCEYVYWDDKGKERTPKDRNFRPGEIEELYTQPPTFDYSFTQSVTALDALVMLRIVEFIDAMHPEFELKLDSFHSRGQPHAKFTVLHKEVIEEAREHVAKHYESLIAALEGKQEQRMDMLAAMIGNPQPPSACPVIARIRSIKEAQTLYAVWSQTIAEKRRGYELETDLTVKCKLKQQIAEHEADLTIIEQRLDELSYESQEERTQ